MAVRSFIASVALIGSLSLVCPTRASAQTWDFLFEDLPLSSEDGGGGNWAIDIGGFADTGTTWSFPNSDTWGYLFEGF
ncbi:MAG: hypothetical protein PHI23_00005 [Candidatus Peribacteraceae bacterium]|nr:hypothetical protein [Candidatus Peribacteraceae bacterium]